MNPIEVQVRRFDHFQQRHKVLGFTWAVMQKAGNDRSGALAARVAYYGLFAIFPLLLLFTTILGFVLEDNPHLRNEILNSALANFPVIGSQLKKNTHSLQGSGLALAIGIAGTIYGSFGLAQSIQAALNSVWNIPYVNWPNFFLRRARGLAVFAILGVAILLSGALNAYAAEISGIGKELSYAGSVVINFLVFMTAFLLLTAEPLKWRDVLLGVVLATFFWELLLGIGSWYMSRELSHASATYGFFAIVIALLSWMYLSAQLTLYAAEINVVLKYRLWPRTITQPPLNEGDRRTFSRLAAAATRRPEYYVETHFRPSADEDPFEQVMKERARPPAGGEPGQSDQPSTSPPDPGTKAETPSGKPRSG